MSDSVSVPWWPLEPKLFTSECWGTIPVYYLLSVKLGEDSFFGSAASSIFPTDSLVPPIGFLSRRWGGS